MRAGKVDPLKCCQANEACAIQQSRGVRGLGLFALAVGLEDFGDAAFFFVSLVQQHAIAERE